MTGPWSELGFSAGGAIKALAATSAQVVETYARGRIELARAELRQGNLEDGATILNKMLARLEPVPGATGDGGGIHLARAIALSVMGQGLEQSGDVEGARSQFAEAVDLFEALPDELLNARDHSDFGIALAVTGAEAEGLKHLHLAREVAGSTPEAARYLAAILLRSGESSGAEKLLHEALLTTPADAEALGMLARIQVDRDDPEALPTLTSAAYALLIRGRNEDALEVLDLLEQRSGQHSPVVGVRAEALRLAGRQDEALAQFDAALEQAPDSSWLLAGSASALLALDRAGEARRRAALALVNEPDDLDLLNLAGDIALELEDFDAAVGFARQAIAIDPRSAAAYRRLASVAIQTGDSETALGEIRTARLLAPHDLELLVTHGELEMEFGSNQTAAEVFRQICADDSATPAAHAKLAELLGAIDQPEDGLAAAQSAVDQFGYTSELLEVLVNLLLKLDRSTEAVDRLREALALEDHEPIWAVGLARALLAAGEVEEGIAQAGRAIEELPGLAEPWAVKADGLSRLNRWQEAGEAADEALALDSSDVEALAVAGLARLGQADNAGAELLLRKAIGLDPDSPTLQYYLAQTLTDTRPQEAVALIEPLVQQAPDRADYLQTRGRASMRIGRFEAALSDLETAAELAPSDESIWFDLADARRLAGHPDRALAAADRALELAPNSGPALIIRSSVLRALGRDEAARADVLRAVDLDPEFKEAYLQLSNLTTNVEEAQLYLDRARALAPGDRLVDLEQAALYARSDNPKQALDLYNELLTRGRESEAIVGRIDSLRLLGNFTEAVSFAEQAVVETDNDRFVQRALGIALVEGGRAEDGIDVLRQLTEAADDPSSAGDLGWALLADDRVEEALDALELALQTTPSDPWTLNQTARLLCDVGEFEQATALTAWTMETVGESAEIWSRAGWAAQHLVPPDSVRGELAFDRAWNLQPEGLEDPWVLSCRADSRHALGDPRAGEDYQLALDLARTKTAKGTWPLSAIGWCLFRLGDLSAAARTFVEVRSIEDQPGSDVLDLALVTLCHGRSKRALRLYEDSVQSIATRAAPIQRGLLKVAIADLERARIDFPNLESVAELPDAIALLTDALAGLPALRALRFLEQRTE